jgi:hypothetical protein
MPRNLSADVDRNAPAFLIASKWGGNSGFARALGRSFNTTRRWLESGDIPPSEHEAIIAAAKRDNKKLKPEDFVDKRKFNVEPAPPVVA